MKGLKIFNIIIFSIICAIEGVSLYYFGGAFIPLLSGDVAGIIASVFAFLPMFIIFVGIIFVLSIIITTTAKIRIKKVSEQNLPQSKFDRVCIALPWIFLVLDILLFLAFFIICNANK